MISLVNIAKNISTNKMSTLKNFLNPSFKLICVWTILAEIRELRLS